MNCALCSGKLRQVISLGETPPANELLVFQDKQADQDLFDLNLMQCKSCYHLQLDTEVPKERLFSHYVYVSDTGQSNRDHFKAYAAEMTERFSPSFVVDIGSNDGLFLTNFSCSVLGVDPAANIEKKVNTLVDFFNEENAAWIEQVYGKADLITCNNMFAHNRDLSDVVNGVKALLSEDGTFVFEVSYAMSLLENNLFDLIYHEHYHHWNVTPMIQYFDRLGLEVVDARLVGTHGGSVRVFVKHAKDTPESSQSLLDIIDIELHSMPKLLSHFKENVVLNKLRLHVLLSKLKAEGKSISILGYPAKACTQSYYYDLDQEVIDNVYDDNELKIGYYSHKGFKIKNTSEIAEDKPDYLLILAWNYADQLMARFNEFEGKFILPFPEPRIV